MSVPAIRVGQGLDLHPYSDDPERPLVLGGVTFPGERGLAGHSDADVVAHAVTDALLGAAGLGDIGQHFPDTDPALAGADSLELLRRAVADVRAAGWAPANVDCTVVLDRPKLAPVKAELERNLSEAVGAPVTVKGKRSEGIGALGRGEGALCLAVALVVASSEEAP
ncbi:MAG TPA: 2-C-methyl-D-erythritol 2,4-cyclodiphosphate synthase [Acidimicrobiales bacterium]|nr:2-C-methyl-D-erythritol 2,4-cyclodiphosphate synthase [Acidimicrobiales bacterium]